MIFEEHIIKPLSKIYILGTVKNRLTLDAIPSKPGEADVLIQKRAKDEIYYISDASEKELLKKYNSRIYSGLFLGMLIAIIGIIIIRTSIIIF
jgi:hypothetical protein